MSGCGCTNVCLHGAADTVERSDESSEARSDAPVITPQKPPGKIAKLLSSCSRKNKKSTNTGEAEEQGEDAAQVVISMQPMGTPAAPAVVIPALANEGVATPLNEVVANPPNEVVATSPKDTKKKGHKRTPSEAPEASSTPAPTDAPANPSTSKVSRSGSSASSNPSDSSVLTAINKSLGPAAISDIHISPRLETIVFGSDSDKTDTGRLRRSISPTDTVKDEDEESKSSNRMADIPTKDGETVEGVEQTRESPQEPTESLSEATQESTERIEEKDAKSPKKEDEEKKESDHEAKTSRESSQEPKTSRESSQDPDGQSVRVNSVILPRGVERLDNIDKLNDCINPAKFDIKHPFYDKISFFYGDITKIQVDAIVNAANPPLAGGGGVDGAIHNAAGERELQAECKKHARPVPTGQAVVTDPCRLGTHVKKIIHAVGPVCYGRVTNERRRKLLSCYTRAMQLSEENGLRSVAFCCISTGIYGYDNQDAARTVIKFLYKYFSKEENVAKWDRVVLCLFMDIDKKCYRHYIQTLVKNPTYFDDDDEEEEESEDEEDKDKKKKDKKEDEDGKKEDGDENMDKKEGEEKKDKKDDETNEKDKKHEEMESSKKDDKGGEKAETKEDEKMEDTVSKTVEGDDAKKEEAAITASPSNTSTATEKIEKIDEVEEEVGENKEGEKENNEVDGKVKNDDGVMNNLKRTLSEEKEGEPPIKRDKTERESSV